VAPCPPLAEKGEDADSSSSVGAVAELLRLALSELQRVAGNHDVAAISRDVCQAAAACFVPQNGAFREAAIALDRFVEQ